MAEKEAILKSIREIDTELKKLFPIPHRPSRTPLEQMIFTILSQNTTDKNAEKCLENLKKITDNDLRKLLSIPKETLILAVRSCGMYRQKTQAILNVLKDWDSLERKLHKLSPKEGIELLKSYPYIGSKTARVVLTFAFNKNTFPIDTHCWRVLNRLGIFPKSWNKDKISEFMEENFSSEFNQRFHYNLIRFGRTVCKAIKPKCSECPLIKKCSFNKEWEANASQKS
ncbi:MAG: hypothetical protein ABGX27_08525 [Desulfurobacteriaceae bacterium]